MADATVSETGSFDDLNDIEFSDIDSSLVMSLLEDSQAEDADDERLRSVIQSLEAEIINQGSFSETNSEDYQFSDAEKIGSCSTSPGRIYFEEFNMETMPYVISDHFADDIENVVEFVGARDYAEICYRMAMEQEDDYRVLWQ